MESIDILVSNDVVNDPALDDVEVAVLEGGVDHHPGEEVWWARQELGRCGGLGRS